MNTYVVTMQSDKGRHRMRVNATTPENAAKHACDFEGAPARAAVKVRLVPLTPADLKARVEQGSDSHFFEPSTMRFFGDTMANYGVSARPVTVTTHGGTVAECWQLYRRRKVRSGLSGSAYFACDDYRRVFPHKVTFADGRTIEPVTG